MSCISRDESNLCFLTAKVDKQYAVQASVDDIKLFAIVVILGLDVIVLIIPSLI